MLVSIKGYSTWASCINHDDTNYWQLSIPNGHYCQNDCKCITEPLSSCYSYQYSWCAATCCEGSCAACFYN